MIHRLRQRKSFPQSVKITDHAVGWIDAEVGLGSSNGWLPDRVVREGMAAVRGAAGRHYVYQGPQAWIA